MSPCQTSPHLPLALSMGEAAGIGAEITVRAWHARKTANVHPFVYLGPPELLLAAANSAGIEAPLHETEDLGTVVGAWDARLPVLPVTIPEPARPGRPSGRNAKATLKAIDTAVGLVTSGKAGAIVTNPIHKATLYDAGFSFPGHTEYLADLAGAGSTSVMMLVVGDFRTVPVTVHVPLASAVVNLSTDLIVATGRTAAAGLQRYFNVPRPRLAVAGLNPHAGEAGKLGTEERDIIVPAIERLKQMGIDVTGPMPADTMFHTTARSSYDAALCMYHDQALIPIKTIGFEQGVNCTLGLPFIRTSPDHGTALDIAGRGTADPDSLIAALNLAGTMARNVRDR